jgi:hypothetical protein
MPRSSSSASTAWVVSLESKISSAELGQDTGTSPARRFDEESSTGAGG